VKNFINFFKRLGKKITDEEIAALVRRMDLDCDSRHMISKSEFMEFIEPQEPYSRLLTRQSMKHSEDFPSHEGIQNRKLIEKKGKSLVQYKAHMQRQANRVNQIAKFDNELDLASGVSPIKCRHPIDLYGTKCGIGKFNPIMVENINRIP